MSRWSPRLPRVADPTVLARRVAVGTGLADVRRLEQRVDRVAEALAENASLAGPLTDQVQRLEQSLVPVLRRRARVEERAAREADAEG